MRTMKIRGIRCTLSLLLLLLCSLQAQAAGVFVLHSYSQEYSWTSRQHHGFVNAVQDAHEDILISTEYLDTKRHTYDDTYAREMARHLRIKYADYQPDLIYVTDDNALSFARSYLTQLFPAAPIVFSGVNDYRVLESLDHNRITGVFEKKEVAPNIAIMQHAGLMGGRIVFIGDASNTYDAIEHEVRLELKRFSGLNPRFISSTTIEGIVQQLAQCSCKHVILTTIGGIKRASGESLSLKEIVHAIDSAGTFVILSMEDGYLFDGVLGGYVTSGTRQGESAAAMATAILSGATASSLAPLLKSPNEYIFNQREIEKLKISLPDEIRKQATIINARESFYQSNRSLILAIMALLGISLLIVLAVSVVLLSSRKRHLLRVAETLTTQKRVLLHIQEDLEAAQQIASLGSWSLDLATNRLQWSSEIFRIFEIDQQQFDASYEAFLNAIHPDDRELVNSAYSDSVRDKTEYRIEHRLLMPDGRIKYVQERGKTVYDNEGNPVRSYGTVQDITDKKLAEQRLHQWASIFENTIEAVMITDCDQCIVDVNRAYTQITGYSKEEVLGKTPNFRRSGRHDRAFYEKMWNSINDTGSWSGEIWNRDKNGEVMPELHSISTIRDEHDNVVNYIGVFTDISALKRTEEKLEHLANHDPLTGLANRTLLNDRLARAIRRLGRSGSRIAVLFLDLDRFKMINDTLGHPVGDELLQKVAARLKSCLRDSDTIGRLGGDEFLVIIEDYHHLIDVENVVEKLRSALSIPIDINGKLLHAGVSIGISIFPEDGETTAELIRNADAALYRAKEAGRNDFCFYDAEFTRQATEHMAIEEELRLALENSSFTVYYQPKISLASGQVVGAEALVRLLRDDGTLVPPDDFIPISEESGLILPIGKWVLAEAMQQLSIWHEMGYSRLHIAINISGIQIQRGSLVSTVNQLLDETGLQATSLELEVTESVLINFPAQAVEVLGALRKAGVSVALDDFGTGHSSLSNLKRYPISTLKVDKSFVRDIMDDPNDAAITRAVVAMGHSLDINVVAEGVETAEHAEYLKTLGCHQAQGYFYARPMPAAEFIQYLTSVASKA